MWIVELEPGANNDGLGIPYITRPGSWGNTVEYYDLKKEPRKIEEIAETRDFPRVKDLLYSINDATSLVRTVRCERPCECIADESKHILRVHWHFTVAFEFVNLNQSDNWAIFRQQFAEQHNQDNLDSTIRIEFRDIPASFNEHGPHSGVVQDIEVFGEHRDPNIAVERFYSGLDALERYFFSQRRVFKELGGDNLKTISPF